MSFALTLLAAAALSLMIEVVSRGSVREALAFFADAGRPGVATIALFALVIALLDAIIGRAHAGLLIVAPIMLILAFVDSQKAFYLGDPLYPSDILFVNQIVELMPLLVRERPLQAVGFAAAGIAGIVLLVMAWRWTRSRLPGIPRLGRLSRLAIAAPVLFGFFGLMDYATFSWTRDRLGILPMMWDQRENYAYNGFTLAFALNVPMAKVDAPDGYSAEAIEGAVRPAAAMTLPTERPDIIVVMSESFWDPARLPGVTITPDPIADVRANLSGHVFSPEFGGMTANVEFEALTGFSNAFLPYGSIPYQQYVREPVPSLATFLGAQGYDTLAIHPFAGWFWNRAKVYAEFGFDRFLSEENLPAMAKRGPLVSDAALTEEMIRQAEAADKPLFMFAVSLQSHGPYEPGRYDDATHTVDAPVSDWAKASITTYAEGASDADESLARLIEWASKRERHTVIAFFGDHLPPLGPVYVETGFLPEPVAARRGPAGEMALHRETPLVVWSNRDGPVRDIGTISPAFLPLHVLQAAGITHPFYTDFLASVRQRFAVVDRYLLLTPDGTAQQDWATATALDPALQAYRLIQHDMIFGKQFGKEGLFPRKATEPGPPVATLPAYTPFPATPESAPATPEPARPGSGFRPT
ncbi:MAG: LTA synthase family protein [Rhizobiaceae bacterium]